MNTDRSESGQRLTGEEAGEKKLGGTARKLTEVTPGVNLAVFAARAPRWYVPGAVRRSGARAVHPHPPSPGACGETPASPAGAPGAKCRRPVRTLRAPASCAGTRTVRWAWGAGFRGGRWACGS